MIDFHEYTKNWERAGDWRIAPADCPYMTEGALVRVGKGASIGRWAHIGDEARIGAYAHIGAEARISGWATIGGGVSIGKWARVGEGAIIGDRASIHSNAVFVYDLGVADGWRKCLVTVKGVYHIDAGCRHFTMDEARAHWENHKEDRRFTVAQLAYAQALIDNRSA